MIPLGYGVVGSVIRNEAELVAVQRELETARQIQASLLPRALPQATGLDLAARYIPMTAVAGDLYDIVSLGPAQVGILVADVAGHGVPAALVASMVKLAFSTQAEHAGDPARVMAAMNQILCRHVEGTFVTAIYAVVDTERGAITVASAGAPTAAREARRRRRGRERRARTDARLSAAGDVRDLPDDASPRRSPAALHRRRP